DVTRDEAVARCQVLLWALASRPIRGASAVFLTRGGVRWPASKVQDTHPRSRRPKPHGPDALSCASPEAIGRTRAAPSQRRRAGVPHQRWTRSREGPEKENPPGALWSKPQTSRAGRRVMTNLRLLTIRIAFVP